MYWSLKCERYSQAGSTSTALTADRKPANITKTIVLVIFHFVVSSLDIFFRKKTALGSEEEGREQHPQQ